MESTYFTSKMGSKYQQQKIYQATKQLNKNSKDLTSIRNFKDS
jgi:hypothetical protein